MAASSIRQVHWITRGGSRRCRARPGAPRG
jgi:hypothetical protein